MAPTPAGLIRLALAAASWAATVRPSGSRRGAAARSIVAAHR